MDKKKFFFKLEEINKKKTSCNPAHYCSRPHYISLKIETIRFFKFALTDCSVKYNVSLKCLRH